MTTKTLQPLKPASGFDALAWRWMRYIGFLLIPLAWGHVLIQDILVGGHRINLDYVALRWSMPAGGSTTFSCWPSPLPMG